MKTFFNWLVDNYLSRWLVAREDFEVVRWNWRNEQRYNESLIKELEQAYEETYKGFRPFEDYGEGVKAEFIEHSPYASFNTLTRLGYLIVPICFLKTQLNTFVERKSL